MTDGSEARIYAAYSDDNDDEIAFCGKRLLAQEIEEGLKIDPATAEVTAVYDWLLNGHGALPDLRVETGKMKRNFYANRPGVWFLVNFENLPHHTRNALWKKHKSRLQPPSW